MRLVRSFVLALLPMALACVRANPPAVAPAAAAAPAASRETGVPVTRIDLHSFARPNEAVVRHLSLDLSVDFAKRELAGRAALAIANLAGTDTLWLDARDLTIERVTLGPSHEPTTFSVSAPVEFLGSALRVAIRPDTTLVTVEYRTSPDAAALQWLTPEQTAGKKRPFLLTQSQSALARSWVPCQDTPAVRMTYDARVTVPSDLLAVMSAENPTQKNATGVYSFRMPHPIPSYLLALAVGDIGFHAFDARSGVYAEPAVLEKAAWEFADLPKMIDVAEKLYGPYRWGRYDVIVLPPSFPFGGMENPMLTFATPTLLAGDRSLVSVVAHELAHSWSGNLVTNATWNDFWLNEGLTTYAERRIVEPIYGRDVAEMQTVLGIEEFLDDVKGQGETSWQTMLRQSMYGRDPDDVDGSIVYEKGAAFFLMMENAFGREKWDAFVKQYADTFAFQSMDSDGFVTFLRQTLFRDDPSLEAKLHVDEWIYQPGVPPNVPKVASARFAAVDRQAEAFRNGGAATSLATSGWTTPEWLRFLKEIPRDLGTKRMGELDAAFHFSDSGNSEILAEWLSLSIANRYEAAYPALERFLTGMGRRKFLMRLYGDLAKTPEGKTLAKRIYEKARPGYHPVSQATVDQILGQ